MLKRGLTQASYPEQYRKARCCGLSFVVVVKHHELTFIVATHNVMLLAVINGKDVKLSRDFSGPAIKNK